MKFLDAAYEVLKEENKPLSCLKIVEKAIEKKLIVSSGKTPEKSMGARLSIEMRKKGSQSIFQRVGSNRSSLREWGLPEYVAQQFKKKIPKEIIVCIKRKDIDSLSKGFFGLSKDYQNVIEHISNPNNVCHIPRKEAEDSKEYMQLVSYITLSDHNNRYVSYLRGSYSNAHPTLLKGKRSIGFGGHVIDEDINLFGMMDGGIKQAAIREVSEELKRLNPLNIKCTGVIWDDSSYEGQRHLGVILDAKLPHDFKTDNVIKELSPNLLSKLTLLSLLWLAAKNMMILTRLGKSF